MYVTSVVEWSVVVDTKEYAFNIADRNFDIKWTGSM